LGFAKFHLAAGAFEDFGHRDAYIGKNLIDDAGDEERDSNGH
jgi:hypothetical protein